MASITCKFGGTSTATSNMFRQIGRILDENPARRYIVLSAPGGEEKVTDMIYRYCAARREGKRGDALLYAVAARYQAIGDELGVPGMGTLARDEIQRGAEISDTHAASRGEYLCAKLFARWRGIPFIDAAQLVSFDAAGVLMVPETLRRFRALAHCLVRAVIPGFYGSGPDGHIVTFPRNGSDITGALCAAGTGADLYENWSDVPGLMTADPNLDPEATVIPEISYAAMHRLSENGARVLHPDSLEPLARAGIPTRLKCTMTPKDPGTLVTG